MSASRRHPWTERELAVLRARYPEDSSVAVAKALGRPLHQVYGAAYRYGIKKSEAFLASDKSCRIQRGKQNEAMRASQFKLGHPTWNKGKKGSTGKHPNCRKTQFKKGCMAGAAQAKYVPIGTERVSHYGVLERKITDDPKLYPARRWVPVGRLVWEAAHGPIPPKHAVRFKPGMATTVAEEITADKLECISFAENMRRNTIHRYPKPLADVMRVRGVLNRKINNRTKENA